MKKPTTTYSRFHWPHKRLEDAWGFRAFSHGVDRTASDGLPSKALVRERALTASVPILSRTCNSNLAREP